MSDCLRIAVFAGTTGGGARRKSILRKEVAVARVDVDEYMRVRLEFRQHSC